MRRRLVFSQKQSHEHLVFAFMMSTIAFNLHSSTRSLWAEERNTYWWEHIVRHTFSHHDWLRMSQETFLHVCDKLHSTVDIPRELP